MKYIILAGLGYIFGTIPFSYIVAKTMGDIDVRQHGSGNAGATNVLRTVGKKAALFALLGDLAKGLIPAIIGRYFFGVDGAMLCAMFAVIGHCYPVTLGFKGGKGVATAGGMIVGVNLLIAIALFIYMLIVVKITKYVSLASVTAALIYPIIIYFLYGSIITVTISLVLSTLVIYKHRENIYRLFKGQESKTDLLG